MYIGICTYLSLFSKGQQIKRLLQFLQQLEGHGEVQVRLGFQRWLRYHQIWRLDPEAMLEHNLDKISRFLKKSKKDKLMIAYSIHSTAARSSKQKGLGPFYYDYFYSVWCDNNVNWVYNYIPPSFQRCLMA